MTVKVYIVANKEQELEVLKRFEQEGLKWAIGRKPTEFLPGNTHPFPIALFERDWITWDYLDNLKNEEIVYDGRNEDEEVDTRYKVTQEFMDKLVEWRDKKHLDATSGMKRTYISPLQLDTIPRVFLGWQLDAKNPIERNKRLIAIIQWLNGEDVFEVEKPHKFVVRSEHSDTYEYYAYVEIDEDITKTVYQFEHATKFDTREEAQEWANSHQVVVEIDAEGNEVE